MGRVRSRITKPPHVAAAEQYIEDVLSGVVPACKWVVAACQRQKDDLSRKWSFRFDEDKAEKVCRFIELLPHIKGPKAGEPIKLEPWQCFILTTIFGWVRKDTGKRRFRRSYIEVPRGNAKSTLSSGVGLYMMALDGEGGAECYSAATTRDQARIVFRDAQQMARRSPEFRANCGVDVNAHNINQLSTASKFEALAAEDSTLDGLNIHFVAVDELHAHKTRGIYDVLETGTGKRDQSLMWCITTAGSDRTGICYEQRTFLSKVLDGVANDDGLFGIIYTVDDDDDWTQQETWQKANPNWGVSVQPDVVAQLCAKAMQMPAAQNNFKTKHLDIWVNADTAWMDQRAWDRCADPSLNRQQFAGQRCIVGLDLASKVDIAARMDLFWRDIDNQRHYYAFGRFYLPESALHDSRNSQYAGWEISGRLVTTPGEVIDFQQIEDDLIYDSTFCEISAIVYDPWQAEFLSQRLRSRGANAMERRNTVGNFSEPMKELESLVRQERFHHDGDPVLSWMVSNVVCHTDAKENIYPRKERPENKIDGVVALIMALGHAITNPIQSPSIYETRRDFLTFGGDDTDD